MTRIAVAFMVLPIFSSQLIPPLIRNSIFVALTLVVLSVQSPVDPIGISGTQLVRVFSAEAFVGMSLGIFFGLFLWAFEAAGQVIDTTVGSSIAMIFDPISGNEVTLIGELLGRWVNYLFMASGGMLIVTGLVLKSYILWPLGQPLPELELSAIGLFQQHFTRFLSLTLMIASPILVVIFIVDMSMGLVNRFAQQLNVLFLSISIKSLVALLMLLLLISTLTELFLSKLNMYSAAAISYLEALFVAQ